MKKELIQVLFLGLIFGLILGSLISMLFRGDIKEQVICSRDFKSGEYITLSDVFEDTNGWKMDIQSKCDSFCGDRKGIPVYATLIKLNNSNERQLKLDCGCLTKI